MKEKVTLICLFVSISLVVLSTGTASWQDPLQVSGSIITGSWKEPEQIGLAGELGPGAPVEELLDGTGLPVGEAEDPDAGDGLDTSTPPEENGDGVDGAGAGTVDPGMGQEPGDVAVDVEGEAEPAEVSGVDVSETGSSLTAAEQGFAADDKGMTSPHAPDSTGVSDTPGVSDIPDVPENSDIPDAEVDDDAGDNNGAEADEADNSANDTVADADDNDGANDAAVDDTGEVAD